MYPVLAYHIVVAGVTFEAWEAALLDELPVARLATIQPSGRPHLVPVCFAVAAGQVAIAVDEKPKTTTALARLRNIARDPRVALLVDRYDADWSRLAWLRIDGEAAVLERGEVRPDALAALRARYAQYAAMDLESRPLILVVPAAKTSWRAQAPWARLR